MKGRDEMKDEMKNVAKTGFMACAVAAAGVLAATARIGCRNTSGALNFVRIRVSGEKAILMRQP